MDFSSYGLAEDVAKKLKADYDADVAGLKNKVAEKVDGIKALQSRVSELETEKVSALEEAENAKVTAAEKAGDIEAYKKAIEEKDNAITSIKREMQERENDLLIKDHVSDFSKNIAEDKAAQHYMNNMFKDSIEVVDGQVRPKDSAMTMDQLKDSFIKGEDYQSYVKASVGSGSGAAGSTGGGAAPAGKSDFSGSQSEKVNAAIAANPKLAALPVK